MRRLALLLFVCVGLSLTVKADNSNKLDLTELSPEIREQVLKKFPTLQTDHFGKVDLDLLIKYLIALNYYDFAKVTYDHEVYHLKVDKEKTIKSIKFSGNNAFSDYELGRTLEVKDGSKFDQNSVIEAAEKIRQLYFTNGYRNASIDIEFTDAPDNQVDLVLKIHENLKSILKDVKIECVNHDLQKKLETKLASYKNKTFTNTLSIEIRDTAKEYFIKNKYYKAELVGPEINYSQDESQVTIGYKVIKPDFIELSIDGDYKLSKGTIQDSIELDKILSTESTFASELANKVKNLYLSKGYARVDVSAEEEQDSQYKFTRNVRIHIKEGPKISIEKFELSGNFSQSTEDYIKFIKNHSSDLVSDGYYNRDDIDTGLKNLITDLENQGYLKAKIVTTRSIYNKDKNKISILINLEEGPLTIINQINFIGNKSFKNDDLLNVIKIYPKEPLHLNKMQDSLNYLKNYYMNLGYLEMSVSSDKDDLIKYKDSNTEASINFKIVEGPKIVVAAIVVEGNTLTKDYVILKELDFKVGDVLTPQSIEESTRRLQALGFFGNIEIKTLEDKTLISNRTIIVKVIDRDPGLFNVGAGFNTEYGYTARGYTGIAYRNLYGTGRGASARAETTYNFNDFKYLEYKLTAGYLEPYIFDTRIRGRINVTRSVSVDKVQLTTPDPNHPGQIIPGSSTADNLATELNQTTYSLEQDITSHVLLIWDVYNIATLHEFSIIGTENFAPTLINIGSTDTSLDIDYRDNQFNPSKGTFTRFNIEYGAPWLASDNTIEYVKTQDSFTHYLGFYKPGWVWANSVHYGYLKNLSSRSDGGVPYYAKGFILGGPSTIRGFAASEAFLSAYDLGSDNYLITSSAEMYLVKSEIRFPVYGSVGGALFYDGGAVIIQNFSGNLPYRNSVGVGIRYITPVGALSADVGYKLDQNKARGESQFPLHLSIGTF